MWNECCLGLSVGLGWQILCPGFTTMPWWLQLALFKNLNYFNIWHLNIEWDQRASLLATIIVFILAYECADDRRTLIHTKTHTKIESAWVGGRWVYRKKGKKTGEANHQMIPLACITELFYVNRWLMRPWNCVWERLRETELDKEYRRETER